MVRPEGLKPPTSWVETTLSVQLRYGRIVNRISRSRPMALRPHGKTRGFGCFSPLSSRRLLLPQQHRNQSFVPALHPSSTNNNYTKSISAITFLKLLLFVFALRLAPKEQDCVAMKQVRTGNCHSNRGDPSIHLDEHRDVPIHLVEFLDSPCEILQSCVFWHA